ncbi:THC0290_0291 family protein [Flavobacterium sp.]|uniref:THC0290_0291 family protein n=1 Tax=Flavobacterium sp. TaxID=239 RepID=UPI00286D9370|nr:DUF6089 family protein [Flavobacterium sp.]
MLNKILITSILVFSFNFTQAQYGRNYKEIGFLAGPVFFQSDYGQRNNFDNYINNNGYNIGVYYYLTPNENTRSIREYFKLRLDLNFMKSDLKHYGKYVEGNSVFKNQLKGMRGKTQTLSLGSQIEFYPFRTDDYRRGYRFSPYISFGAQINYYDTTAFSLNGPLGNSQTTPTKYLGAYRNEGGSVASISTSIGTRYKLSNYDALTVDFKAQYYFSDWVDGLNPNRRIYTENKSNDWSTIINFGYVYYFE